MLFLNHKKFLKCLYFFIFWKKILETHKKQAKNAFLKYQFACYENYLMHLLKKKLQVFFSSKLYAQLENKHFSYTFLLFGGAKRDQTRKNNFAVERGKKAKM
jgi:hypothetical protein